MINIMVKDRIKIYNDGILIIEGETLLEIEETIKEILIDNDNIWEIELLNRILYTIYINLSTQEVA